MAKQYGLKGVNDEQTTCCVCGKVELERVMWLVELDDGGSEVGEPFHCGTTCGSRLMGRSISKVNTAVANYQSRAISARHKLVVAKMDELGYYVLVARLREECPRFLDRQQHPEYGRLAEIANAAQAWAAAQDITIPI